MQEKVVSGQPSKGIIDVIPEVDELLERWGTVFADIIMAVAAVDRLIHHALIVAMQADSDRKCSATTRSVQAGSLSKD